MTTTILRSGDTRVTIAGRGAEMLSVVAGGHEWIWPGEPPWEGRSPILFPIVGSPGREAVRWEGRDFPMRSHGFARDEDFAVDEAAASSAEFLLRANEATRTRFPFAFALSVGYALAGRELTVEIAVANEDAMAMPVQFGLHPGFTVPGIAVRDAMVAFEKDEAPEVDRLRRGCLEERCASPLENRVLPADEGAFAAGAFLFERVRSRRVWLGVPGETGVEVAFDGFPQLAVWSKPPGRFVCIEPWRGCPVPDGFTGSLDERGGVVMLAPGETARARCVMSFGVERAF